MLVSTTRCVELLRASHPAYLPKTRHRLDAFLRGRARSHDPAAREAVIDKLLAEGIVTEDDCGGLEWNDGTLHGRQAPPPVGCPKTSQPAAVLLAISPRTSGASAQAPLHSSGSEFETASFDDMDLSDKILRGIYSYGFEWPSHVQAWAIPRMAAGRHVLVQAKSGAGKTAAFAVGILARTNFETRQGPQALILTQGRELAQQIHKVVLVLGEYLQAKSHCCIGGTSVRDDIDQLRDGQHVVVGVPGRIKDMIEKRHLKLDKLKVLVLDEADALLSNMSVHQGIVGRVPRGAQRCFFATTLQPDQLHGQLLARVPDVDRLLVSRNKCHRQEVRHFRVDLEKEKRKLDTLCDLYETLTIKQSLVFFNSIDECDWVADQMTKRKFTVSVMHNELDQKMRDLVMREFRSGTSRLLLATDVISRGIDVQQVSVVLNYDFPSTLSTYVHRAGRTARLFSTRRRGVVINFVTQLAVDLLQGVESHLDLQIKELPLDLNSLL